MACEEIINFVKNGIRYLRISTSGWKCTCTVDGRSPLTTRHHTIIIYILHTNWFKNSLPSNFIEPLLTPFADPFNFQNRSITLLWIKIKIQQKQRQLDPLSLVCIWSFFWCSVTSLSNNKMNSILCLWWWTIPSPIPLCLCFSPHQICGFWNTSTPRIYHC